jgi:hydroxyquinol 1,2-dioxygenase
MSSPYVTEQNITDVAAKRWSGAKTPREAQLFEAMVRHLHAFAREVELTPDEWMTGLNFLGDTGKLVADKRHEFILLSDVLGLSMLVVMMNTRAATGATPNTVLGPFHIEGSPELEMGADMAAGAKGTPCFVSGNIRDLQGKPIQGVSLDCWQADGDGMYEAQIPGQEEPLLRAIYKTGADGKFIVRSVDPLGYSIPMDGTVGRLIRRTSISEMRPAHIHFFITAPGYAPVITHLFRDKTNYLETDVVYGVKQELITPFHKHAAGEKAPTGEVMTVPFVTVDYDFTLVPAAKAKAA